MRETGQRRQQVEAGFLLQVFSRELEFVERRPCRGIKRAQRNGVAAVAGGKGDGMALEGFFEARHAVPEILAPRQQVHAQQAVVG